LAKEQKFFGASRGLGPRASRRCLLQAGLTIGTLALGQRAALGQSGGAHVHMPELGVTKLPVVPAMDQPLVEPEVRRSVNGVLSTSLSCAYAYRDIGGKRLYLRSYEGGLGPTLRMKPGETLKIRLTNGFPPNRDLVPRDLSRPHQFNNTNFHFHGAHCSPSGIADNVMRTMVPGKSYDIEITLPADHTRGTYWYHPHHHGSADVQVASGMAGAIIVEGDFANVPEIVQARERVMLLAQVVFDAFSMVEDFVTVVPESSTRFLAINGQRRPTIDMRPGEVQRWRLLGSQYQNYMLLELDQHRLNVIAYDGIQLGTVQEMKQLLIAPGQRADVLVQAGGPGTYELNAMPFDQVHPMSAGPLARVVVAGEPLPMKLPAALPKPPLETIRDSEITCRRTLVLSTIGDPPENDPGGQWQEFTLMIDGKTFDPSRIDQRVRLGAVEEWTIRNPDLRDDHAFHIHVNPFQVTQVNGQPQADLQWRDTVLVPRKGSVVLRSRFLDYTGVFMLHCHMMNHEEMGMMQAIEVYKEADGPIVYEGVVYDADSICSSRGK
jgi:FtsP/CotA-like multicopper oxidase with cupredoxin domain